MSEEITSEGLRAEVARRFGVDAARVGCIRSPYRICPLGAHVDHQLGRVTAMALDRGTLFAWAPSGSAAVRLMSRNFPGEVAFAVDAIPPAPEGEWGDYARGAALAMSRSGRPLRQGIVGVTSGWLVEGGLSSSASVGLAYLMALAAANDQELSPSELIALDQAIENDYLGLRNGILDQAAIVGSRRDHLSVIDCLGIDAARRSESTDKDRDQDSVKGGWGGVEVVARCAGMPAFAVLVAFSGVTRAIGATDYNRRVGECREAARSLLSALGRSEADPVLGRVSALEYAAHRRLLTGAPARRAEHFFSEQQRVSDGIAAWAAGDLARLGRLMSESGRSSIELYECGSPPLVDLYEVLVTTPGVVGARFSGAGFRGCCVALVEAEGAESLPAAILARYAARQPELAARASIHLCQTDDGVRHLCRP